MFARPWRPVPETHRPVGTAAGRLGAVRGGDGDTVDVDPPGAGLPGAGVPGRGSHSSTFRLNVSAFCGTGGAVGGCLGGVLEVLRVMRGCLECILCQKRLRLS